MGGDYYDEDGNDNNDYDDVDNFHDGRDDLDDGLDDLMQDLLEGASNPPPSPLPERPLMRTSRQSYARNLRHSSAHPEEDQLSALINELSEL